jgi:poly(A) polymerase
MVTRDRRLEDLANQDPDQFSRSLALAFREAGEELYLVGGAVRDALLGMADFDLDFATSARPPVTVGILEALGQGRPYRIGERFGTIGLRLGQKDVEVTTYRSKETYPPRSRKPDVQFGTRLEEDLGRRDFTINAMARDPISGETIDLFGGTQDLGAGLIRAVGEAVQRFREDPLRLLRAVRFACRLDFDIEPATWAAMRADGPWLETVSRERVRDEMTRMLEGTQPARALTLLRDSGLLARSVPRLALLDSMPDHGPRHPLSLWDHTMAVVSGVPPTLALRWAAVLHDIAKPVTRTHEPSGRPRFFHHEEEGARLAREILTGLRYSNQVVEDVALLVETHMQPHAYSEEWSDGAVRRLMVRLGPLLHQSIELARADAAGHALDGPVWNTPKFDALERRVRALDEEQEERLRSPLSGEDLMHRYGRGPGRWIGEIKGAICEALIEGELQPGDTEGAWRIADRIVSG